MPRQQCSNLLLDSDGNLKLGDFGLAIKPLHETQALTTRVITLWYRPPELLLGAIRYDTMVDMWSAGCIFAELLQGEPVLPGRTEVEQLHKIFKLCGSGVRREGRGRGEVIEARVCWRGSCPALLRSRDMGEALS